MEMLIRYTGLPQGLEPEEFKLAVANLMEEDGWLTGSGADEAGHYLELELEDERVNPKHCIVAVRNYLCQSGFPRDTMLELAGVATEIYG